MKKTPFFVGLILGFIAIVANMPSVFSGIIAICSAAFITVAFSEKIKKVAASEKISEFQK